MNKILLRTDKGEYFPGETICGTVYLLIQTPTEAHGVHLSFHGREAVTCECEVDGSKSVLKACHDYVDYSNIDLFVQDEPFAIGNYCFPFRLKLPFVVPGTFFACSNDPAFVWSACVTFIIRTSVLGADAMEAEQEVVVNGAEQQAIAENHMTQAQEVSVGSSLAGFFGLNVFVTVKPLTNFVRTGTNFCLKMIVTNPLKASRCFVILRLVRMLTLTLPYKHRKASVGPGDQADPESLNSDDLSYKEVQVEGGRMVLKEIRGDLLHSRSFSLSSGGGLDNIMIPLKDSNGQKVYPSVQGKYVKCDYVLEVSLQVGDRTSTVKCPIPGILPDENAQWKSWSALPWMQNAQILLSRIPSLATPPEQILDSEAFGRLPRFQVI